MEMGMEMSNNSTERNAHSHDRKIASEHMRYSTCSTKFTPKSSFTCNETSPKLINWRYSIWIELWPGVNEFFSSKSAVYDVLKSVSWVITGRCLVISHIVMILLIDHHKGRRSSTLFWVSANSCRCVDIFGFMTVTQKFVHVNICSEIEPSNKSQVHFNHAAIVRNVDDNEIIHHPLRNVWKEREREKHIKMYRVWQTQSVLQSHLSDFDPLIHIKFHVANKQQNICNARSALWNGYVNLVDGKLYLH